MGSTMSKGKWQSRNGLLMVKACEEASVAFESGSLSSGAPIPGPHLKGLALDRPQPFTTAFEPGALGTSNLALPPWEAILLTKIASERIGTSTLTYLGLWEGAWGTPLPLPSLLPSLCSRAARKKG